MIFFAASRITGGGFFYPLIYTPLNSILGNTFNVLP